VKPAICPGYHSSWYKRTILPTELAERERPKQLHAAQAGPLFQPLIGEHASPTRPRRRSSNRTLDLRDATTRRG
jgi:hypothetical protein